MNEWLDINMFEENYSFLHIKYKLQRNPRMLMNCFES